MTSRTGLTVFVALLIVMWVFAPCAAFGQTTTFDGFMQEWSGRYINYPGGTGTAQCMDLMHQYTLEVLGFDALHAATAYNAYVAGDSRFDKIPNTPTGIPLKGDLVFWNSSLPGSGGAGHVAVFIQGDLNQFTSFDQNFPTGSAPHVQSHSYNYVVGWLHPKNSQPVQVTNFFQKNSNGQYTITCFTDNLVDAQFQLVNSSSAAVYFPEVAMALHREIDDAFVADVHIEYNVTIAAGATYQFPRSFLDGTNPNLVPGTYRLVAKVLYGGVWVELSLHLPFTIASRINTCGSTSDPDVTSLANQTRPVGWYFFTGASGRWYIANTSGNVLALESTPGFPAGGTLPWKPISNYPTAYAGFPAQGVNYSYVQISSDGRNVSFGYLTGGGGDSEIAQLANTTQPVKWMYFQDSRTIWYIFDLYWGTQAVMRLMGYDPTVNGDILWKPINNYTAFLSYPAAGYVYQNVYASSDGRSVIFGPLK